MSQEERNTEAILKAIDSLGQRVGVRIEEVNTQLQQHSAMLSTIAKLVQLNAKE